MQSSGAYSGGRERIIAYPPGQMSRDATEHNRVVGMSISPLLARPSVQMAQVRYCTVVVLRQSSLNTYIHTTEYYCLVQGGQSCESDRAFPFLAQRFHKCVLRRVLWIGSLAAGGTKKEDTKSDPDSDPSLDPGKTDGSRDLRRQIPGQYFENNSWQAGILMIYAQCSVACPKGTAKLREADDSF
jgi:hypothetical protein